MTREEKNKFSKNNIVTFGCRLNAYESELIKKAVEESKEENLLIFNSCAVTQEAEKELCYKIRREKKKNPHLKIVVTGCAAQIDPEKYAKMKEVDLVIGNDDKSNPKAYLKHTFQKKYISNEIINQNKKTLHQDKIFLEQKENNKKFLTSDELEKIKVNDIMSVKETAPQLVSYFENQTRAFLEIQNGCNHRCTFCIIPFGRGNSRSVGVGEIVNQVKSMVKNGHKEIVFTGVDISDYGKDFISPISLTEMIKKLFKLVPELPRLRLSSIDVAEIDEDFFDLLKNEPRLMPYLHLSIQSGDDMILKRMARRHNRNQVIEFCKKARKIRPDISFGADIIAGFPTENEEMFLNSVKIIQEAGIVFTHIFPYSKRDGTPAAKMPQIDKSIIKERSKILRDAGKVELEKFSKKQIGKIVNVIIEKNNSAKSENFLDVKISNIPSEIRSGDIVTARIVEYNNHSLIAKIENL